MKLNKTFFIISLSVGVLFFIIFNLINDKIKTNLLFSIGVSLFCYFIIIINDRNLKKSPKTVLEKNKCVIKINEHFNFQTESRNNEEYWGLKGYYKKYFIRLYFDPLISSGGGLGILLYYNQPKLENGEIDYNLLNNINAKYEIRGYSKKLTRLFDTSHIRIFANSWSFTSPDKTIIFIEECVEILIAENLIPISEKEIEYLIENDKYIHTPLVTTFK